MGTRDDHQHSLILKFPDQFPNDQREIEEGPARRKPEPDTALLFQNTSLLLGARVNLVTSKSRQYFYHES